MTVEIAAAVAGVVATVLVLASIVFQAGKQSARVDALERAHIKIEATMTQWQQDTKREFNEWRLENKGDLAAIQASISNIREAVVARRA